MLTVRLIGDSFWAFSGTFGGRAATTSDTYTVQTVSYLAQRFELGLHDELIFAELTAASVGALDPLL